MHKGISESV